MTPEEALTKIDAVIHTLENGIQSIIEETALDAMALITNRIQQQGLPGKKYSEHKLPPYYFYDTELNAGGRKLLTDHDSKALRKSLKSRGKLRRNNRIDSLDDEGISYREWREANGLQTAFVDLTFTGRMFQALTIVESKKINNVFVVTVGSKDFEVNQKMIWNARRYGDFFLLTKEEANQLDTLINDKVSALIKSVIQ